MKNNNENVVTIEKVNLSQTAIKRLDFYQNIDEFGANKGLEEDIDTIHQAICMIAILSDGGGMYEKEAIQAISNLTGLKNNLGDLKAPGKQY